MNYVVRLIAWSAFILTMLPSFTFAQWGGRSRGGDDTIAYIIISLIVLIVLFLILREVVCWYWKLNQIVGLLKEIKLSLSSTNNEPVAVKLDTKSGEEESPLT